MKSRELKFIEMFVIAALYHVWSLVFQNYVFNEFYERHPIVAIFVILFLLTITFIITCRFFNWIAGLFGLNEKERHDTPQMQQENTRRLEGYYGPDGRIEPCGYGVSASSVNEVMGKLLEEAKEDKKEK